ncbi:hypothetical protein C8Q80DRAFT_1196205 [Daedaleopsis nitida]|nr:hypothetical protein C8Q80DRAFT_1196205 [Daedaleopsis nitida]
MNISRDLILPNPDGDANDSDVSVCFLPELATVLNIVLHVVYDLSCDCYQPTLSTMVDAVDAMATYDLRPHDHLSPSKPLFLRILNHAPVDPIAVYALAAHHDLDLLAVQVSSYLLPMQLQSLPTAYAVRMGPLYLKRLFFLHLGRNEALRRICLPLPHPHPPSPKCSFVQQKKLARAWALTSAFLVWDEQPDLPASAIQAASASLMQNLSCDECKDSLALHVKQIIVKWSMVKRTI